MSPTGYTWWDIACLSQGCSEQPGLERCPQDLALEPALCAQPGRGTELPSARGKRLTPKGNVRMDTALVAKETFLL